MSTDIRDNRLNIRVSDSELNRLKAMANDANMTLADWTRAKLFGHGDELTGLRSVVNDLNQRLKEVETQLKSQQAA